MLYLQVSLNAIPGINLDSLNLNDSNSNSSSNKFNDTTDKYDSTPLTE